MAPLPHGSSVHRSMACSRPLQRYWSRSRTYHRPHVSISASFPRGLGFLGNPSHMPYPVDTCSWLSTTRGYAVPHLRMSLKGGPHSSPGCSGGYPGRLQTRPALSLAFWPKPIIRVGLSHITTIHPWIRMPVRIQLGSAAFSVGCCVTACSPRLADCWSVATAGDRL